MPIDDTGEAQFEGKDGLKWLLEKGAALHSEENSENSQKALCNLVEELLRVRDRSGQNVKLIPNRAQEEFERRRGQRNIVLKARQMGISTWVSGRLFLKTVTKPGTLTVQVAHTQEAAESLFRMVHRFVDCLPEGLRDGALRASKSSVRQIVFPELDSEYRVESAGDTNAGRGLTITNLHCSEVARWPGDAAETLQGLRAAMPPMGELILESTPMGAGGCFWREWQEAPSTGMVQHFFPWWIGPAYAGMAVCEMTLAPLANLAGLTFSSITTSTITVDAGTVPPTGGGFEVRRRDWAFGPGTNSDLVLRSPVNNFTIPREAAVEQYYIRMYDGSTPPNYSRFSSAVFANIPL